MYGLQPFQGGDTGSNPVGVTNKINKLENDFKAAAAFRPTLDQCTALWQLPNQKAEIGLCGARRGPRRHDRPNGKRLAISIRILPPRRFALARH